MVTQVWNSLVNLKDKVVSILKAIASFGILILFGWLLIKKTNKDADKTLQQNEADKQKLADIDKQIDQNNQQLDQEASKREEINKQIQENDKDVSKEDLVKHFNDPNNKPS